MRTGRGGCTACAFHLLSRDLVAQDQGFAACQFRFGPLQRLFRITQGGCCLRALYRRQLLQGRCRFFHTRLLLAVFQFQQQISCGNAVALTHGTRLHDADQLTADAHQRIAAHFATGHDLLQQRLLTGHDHRDQRALLFAPQQVACHE